MQTAASTRRLLSLRADYISNHSATTGHSPIAATRRFRGLGAGSLQLLGLTSSWQHARGASGDFGRFCCLALAPASGSTRSLKQGNAKHQVTATHSDAALVHSSCPHRHRGTPTRRKTHAGHNTPPNSYLAHNETHAHSHRAFMAANAAAALGVAQQITPDQICRCNVQCICPMYLSL